MPRPPVTVDQNRAKLIKAAAGAIGAERLAELLGIKYRSLAYFMAGERQASDGLVADVRRHLIAHRQQIGQLIQLFREHEGSDDEDR